MAPPGIINGAVIANANAQVIGGAAVAEINYDAAMLNQVRLQLGNDLFSRSPFVVESSEADMRRQAGMTPVEALVAMAIVGVIVISSSQLVATANLLDAYDTSLINMPLLTTPGYPAGFEVKIIGPSRNRQVLTRLVLMAHYGSNYEAQQASVSTAARF